MKPYYSDDKVTLYHGDCLEVMRTLPDNSVEAIKLAGDSLGLLFDLDDGEVS